MIEEKLVTLELIEKKIKKKEFEKNENLNSLLLPTNENTATNLNNQKKKRIQWSNYFEYMLSVTGFVIDLGNVNIFN
jgi:hypothetical protein